MDAKEKVLATMKEAGQPLNAGKMKIHQIIFNPTGGTQRVSEILLFLLLTFFLAYIQTTEKVNPHIFHMGQAL